MINLLVLILSLLSSFVFGAGILFLLSHKKDIKISRVKFCIFSFALGTGLTSFLMFWFGLIGLSWLVFAMALVILDGIFIVLMLMQKWGFLERPARKKLNWSWLEILLVLIIIFEIGFVFISAGLRPVINFDALNNWAFRGKVFFLEPELAFDSQGNFFLGSQVQQNYPLHIPLYLTWVYFWLGEVNDALVGLVFAFYFLALIGFVFFSIKKRTGWRISLIFTMFLATLPLLNYHGFVAYADLCLSFYFTLAAISLFNYLTQKRKIDLIGAGLFTGLMPWVKNEGLMLAVVLVTVFLIYLLNLFRKKYNKEIRFQEIKRFFSFIYGSLIFFLPWLIFKIWFGFGFDSVQPGSGITFIGWHPEIFMPLWQQIFLSNSFHIWPGVFVLILILFYKKVFTPPYFYLFLMILGGFLAYLTLYIFTASFEFVSQGTVVGRNLITLVPISIFLAALLFKHKN